MSGAEHVLAPGGAVAAAVKWVNDQLDDMGSPVVADSVDLREELTSLRDVIVNELRSGDSKELDEVVRLATPDSSENPDEWDEAQAAGLTHVVCSLQIAATGTRLVSVGVGKVHGVVCWKGRFFDVMAVRGQTHQRCVEHVMARYGRRQRRHLLLVSRDLDNTRWDRREGNILHARDPALGAERRYTDGRTPTYHVGYQNMIEIVGSAKSGVDVAEQLYVSS